MRTIVMDENRIVKLAYIGYGIGGSFYEDERFVYARLEHVFY